MAFILIITKYNNNFKKKIKMKSYRNFNDLLREFINDDFFGGRYQLNLPVRENNTNLTNREYSQNVPATNVYEDEWSYRYELSTPGFTKKDLTIELEDTILVVKGERKVEKTSKSECVSKEYHSTKFYRAFNLPENVVVDEIHAKVENGITNIFLPKVTPTKNKKVNRKIDIA